VPDRLLLLRVQIVQQTGCAGMGRTGGGGGGNLEQGAHINRQRYPAGPTAGPAHALWHNKTVRAPSYEFFYGTRTPAPVVA
jgi:hypothetical protein